MKKQNISIAQIKTIAYTSLFSIIIIAILSIVFLSSCTVVEKSKCTGHDRVIIGYSKNMKHYIVQDDCGRKQIPVRIYEYNHSIGDTLIKKDEFRIIHDLK